MVREKTILGGILFSVTYCLMGVVSGISKYLQSTWGFPSAELTFFNFAILGVCLLPWVIRQGGINALKTKNYFPIFLRSICGFLAFLSFFTASHMLPLVDAVTLFNTAPLWVPLLAMFIVKERLSRKSAFCILGGFIGMLLVMHPRIQGMNFAGDALGLLSGIMMASCIVIMRKLKEEPWQRVAFCYALLGAAMSFALLISSFKMPQGIQWVFFLVMGGCTYVMQWFGTIALHHAKAIVLGPLTYCSIIVSGIIGWLVWGSIPTLLTVVGMIAIVASGILILIFEKKEKSQGLEETPCS